MAEHTAGATRLVWDLPLRATHWALVLCVAGSWATHYAGAGWSRAGEFTTRQAWLDYVAACVARARAPVTVTIEARP